jgi:hypothetical protein
MRTATHTFDTLQDLNDALPSLPVSAVITDRDGDTIPRSSLRHMVGTYAPYTVAPETADQSQLATALMPLADAPDIENVPAASSMHALMECATEIQHGVRQVLEALSPEAYMERIRDLAPAAIELMAEAEAMAAPSLLDQDGDDDGREAAPLDASKSLSFEGYKAPITALDPTAVRAGDTVTLTGPTGRATVTGPVSDVVYIGGGEWDIRIEDTSTYRVGRIGLWALTDHQPAPEPEPEWKPGATGTAEVVREGANGGPRMFRRTRGMVVHRPAPIDDDMFVTTEGDLWALEGNYCKDFVPDEPRPLPTREHLRSTVGVAHLGAGNGMVDRITDAVMALLTDGAS